MATLPPPLALPERMVLQEIIGVDGESNTLDFTIYGKPRALKRSIFVSRLNRGVNPDRRRLAQFRQNVRQQLGRPGPYFPDVTTSVQLGVTFRVKRPTNHYINGDRSSNRINPRFLNSRVTGGDVDNMVKFVLDACNGVLYSDDRQVVSIYSTKIWASEGDSEGSTTIGVKLIL